MKDVKTYHKNFVRFLKIVVFLQNAFNTCDEFDECFNDDLLNFCKNDCADCSDFNELKEVISGIKIKNKRSRCKIAKFMLQIYAFVHHSHLTGKIYGYAHNFCNMKVRENQFQFFCITHSFFGFDMLFLIKEIRLSFWGTKDINVGGSGLMSINFAIIGLQVKFIDTLKYF